MTTAIRFIIVLGLICLFMGGGVAVLYGTFQDRIAQKEAAALQEALGQVLPETAEAPELVAGSLDDGDYVFVARDESGTAVGYAAEGGAQGYSSVVRALVGTEADGRTIRRVVVLSQQETPGLGANVSLTRSKWTLWEKIGRMATGSAEDEPRENAFLDKFPGRTADRLGEVDAITAATITSDAVKAATVEALGRIAEAAANPSR